jgi:hypothetical protein
MKPFRTPFVDNLKQGFHNLVFKFDRMPEKQQSCKINLLSLQNKSNKSQDSPAKLQNPLLMSSFHHHLLEKLKSIFSLQPILCATS